MKPAAVAKYGLVAIQTIIVVYKRPKDGLTADVLSNVVWQFWTHTSIVVEQVANPLPREQFFVQAWANVSVDPPAPEVPPLETAPPAPPVATEPAAPLVPPVADAPPVAEAPPAPPVAEAPPVAPVVPPVPPVLLLQEQQQEDIPIITNNDPIMF